MDDTSPAKRLKENRWTILNIASILVQAGLSVRRGNRKRAALLLGTALIASRHPRLSYVIQGAITANDIRKKFTGSP
jgi:hypothetical protein